ncbi:unnamed protein product [Hermetia illucens]|uniref:Serine/threonine-protein phosphatase 2A activator n=1 Tax=Hermetia illucens TaxID=343691 RepID=A0A7R8UFM2_HERIL|nr:serine/threonine-protein phosphatase 2A activator-like [Hermetia illucens]CAD7079684.1 unnamed protein product [Hermetia illucens]
MGDDPTASEVAGDSRESTPTFKVPESTEHTYAVPTKCVKTEGDMMVWMRSEAYYDIVGFINGISLAIQGKKLTDDCPMSATMRNLLEVFTKLNALIDATPPIAQPQRFGNKAYRDWFKKMQDNAFDYLCTALPPQFKRAVPEIVVYFTESFGNATRIDYGTGHELSFIMFLCCLFKIEALIENDNVACALKLFNTYLVFVRRLQLTYRMEPAGSHGVWSLDDYQFVPFIWGSAQFAVNSPIDPHKFLDEEVIQQYKNHYMFISCIDYICQVKTGHFAEHSNQLWSISAVQSWSKIHAGLVKMYQKEILSKFPVVQHILFGSLMTFKPVKPGTVLSSVRLGMLPDMSKKPMPTKLGSGDMGAH